MLRLVVWHRALPTADQATETPPENAWAIEVASRLSDAGAALLGCMGGTVVAAFGAEEIVEATALIVELLTEAEHRGLERHTVGIAVGELREATEPGLGLPRYTGQAIDRAQDLAHRGRPWEIVLDPEAQTLAHDRLRWARQLRSGTGVVRGHVIQRLREGGAPEDRIDPSLPPSMAPTARGTFDETSSGETADIPVLVPASLPPERLDESVAVTDLPAPEPPGTHEPSDLIAAEPLGLPELIPASEPPPPGEAYSRDEALTDPPKLITTDPPDLIAATEPPGLIATTEPPELIAATDPPEEISPDSPDLVATTLPPEDADDDDEDAFVPTQIRMLPMPPLPPRPRHAVPPLPPVRPPVFQASDPPVTSGFPRPQPAELLRHAVDAIRADDFDAMDQCIDMALQSREQTMAAHRIRALAKIARGDLAEALRLIGEARRAGNGSAEPRTLLAEGLVLLHGGQALRAARLALRALGAAREARHRTGEAATLYGLGACFRALERVDAARRVDETADQIARSMGAS